MSYPMLSRPLVVGPHTLPNRLVMPPMVVFRAGEDGSVTPEILNHYRRCTGFGLVVVEATAVSPEGRLARRQIGLFEDRHMAGLRELARAIHANGSLAAIQIHHAGRNTTTEKTFGRPLLAPSAINPGGETPRELSQADISRILDDFAAAARRAEAAGFDALEIHGAHGYLLSQFLSPAANRRTDAWGGSFDHRLRFPLEVLCRVRAAVSERTLVYARLGVADGEDGGLTLADGVRIATRLVEAGLPLLHVSNGIGVPTGLAPTNSPFSDRMHLAAAVRREVNVPIIGVGGIRRPEEAERALADGLADLVAVGKATLADPAWATKALTGRAADINVCRLCPVCHHYADADRCPARLVKR